VILATPAQIAEYTALGAWGEVTLDDIFRANVAAHPNRLALADAPNRAVFSSGEPRRLTYRELAAEVERVTGGLIGAGLRKDDVVVTQMPNIAELAIVYLACARLGIIVSPVPVQYREHELRHIFGLTHPRAYIATSTAKGFDHLAMVANWKDGFGGMMIGVGGGEMHGAIALDDLCADPVPRDWMPHYLTANPVNANDIFTVCWTSGTESVPKGVPRSHNNWLMNAVSVGDGAQVQPGDVTLNPFPMTNMAGIGSLFCVWLCSGGTFVLHHPFDLAIFLQQVRDERVQFSVVAPAILNLLAKSPELLATADISSLRSLGSGSAPLDPWMMETFQSEHGIDVVNFFGSNEGITLNGGRREIDDARRRAQYFPRFGAGGYQWANRVSGWIETRLLDENGREITEPGIPGEMAMRGPMVFPGYFRAPEMTAAAFDESGFFRTGDLFEIACEGDDPCYYRFVGRSKEIIIRGGMNISPAELDILMIEHPKLREAAAVGYPDERLGERVCAVVVPMPGADVELSEIVQFLRERDVAVFKLPERLVIVTELPRNAMNKLLRRELQSFVVAS
jgi:cyclohexanecarboxylate-CoA ligase